MRRLSQCLLGVLFVRRYHRIDSKTQDIWDDKEFLHEAARHLKVDHEFFIEFWDVFRNGIQHQASPKQRQGGSERKPYKWSISADFDLFPTVALNQANEEVICINPWKFAEHYIGLFLSESERLDVAVNHAFGAISTGGSLHSFQRVRYTSRLVLDTKTNLKKELSKKETKENQKHL